MPAPGGAVPACHCQTLLRRRPAAAPMAAPCAEEWLCQSYPSTCDAPARPAGTSSCQRPSFCSLTGRLTSRNGGLDETTVLECKHRTCLVTLIRRSLRSGPRVQGNCVATPPPRARHSTASFTESPTDGCPWQTKVLHSPAPKSRAIGRDTEVEGRGWRRPRWSGRRTQRGPR